MIKNLIKLADKLDRFGLQKEANTLDDIIIKLSIKDDDLAYKEEWNKKSDQEKQKIYNDLPTEKQAYEIAHHILDVIGLIPGPGDVADLINVFLYAKKGEYNLAAISLMCMIPAIGTAVGVAIKTGKKLPAKIVFEYEDEIEKIVVATEKYIPNNDKIAAAVNEIISNIKMGADSIDLSTGKTVKSNLNQSIANNTTGNSLNAWYENPKWQEWFSTMISSCITKILNEVTEKETKTRLMRLLVARSNRVNIPHLMQNFGLTKADIDKLLLDLQSRNMEKIKHINNQFNTVLSDLRKNIRFRIITREADAIKYAPSENTLGQAFIENNEILIYLTRFYPYANNPSTLVDELMSTIRHEAWHIIDYRFAEIFLKQSITPISNHISLYNNIYKNLNLENFNRYYKDADAKKMLSYFTNPTELFVRVKELREFLGKKQLTSLDLDNFRKMDFKSVRIDIAYMHIALRGVQDEQLKIIAETMNKVL